MVQNGDLKTKDVNISEGQQAICQMDPIHAYTQEPRKGGF